MPTGACSKMARNWRRVSASAVYLGQQRVDLLVPPLGQAEVDLPLEQHPERPERVDLAGPQRNGHVVEHRTACRCVPADDTRGRPA